MWGALFNQNNVRECVNLCCVCVCVCVCVLISEISPEELFA